MLNHISPVSSSAARDDDQPTAGLHELPNGFHFRRQVVLSLGISLVCDHRAELRIRPPAKRALFFGYYSFKGVKNILEVGLDRVEIEEPDQVPGKMHTNIRGTGYYS